MRKKKFAIFVAVLLMTGILGFGIFTNSTEKVTTFQFTEEIQVVDGVADITEHSFGFGLEEDETYVVNVKWKNEKPGLVSGIAIKDAAGEIVFFCTGDTVDAESAELELAAGEYVAQYLYFTNLEQLMEAATMADADSYGEMEEFAITGNETYEVNYYFEIGYVRSTEYNLGLLCGMLVGMLAGLAFVGFMLKYIRVRKEGSNFEYDERQQVARGNGFKYAYITSIIYSGILCMITVLGNPLPVDLSVLILGGILISMLVCVAYCIWHDAYVSLNENANRLIVMLSVFGGMNLLIGISHIVHGTMIENGVLTYHCMNLLCGIALLIITAILLVHMKRQKADEE